MVKYHFENLGYFASLKKNWNDAHEEKYSIQYIMYYKTQWRGVACLMV